MNVLETGLKTLKASRYIEKGQLSQEIIAAATTNGGKLLLDKLAIAKKAVAANEDIALQNANANEKAIDNNAKNNPTGQIKPANK